MVFGLELICRMRRSPVVSDTSDSCSAAYAGLLSLVGAASPVGNKIVLLACCASVMHTVNWKKCCVLRIVQPHAGAQPVCVIENTVVIFMHVDPVTCASEASLVGLAGMKHRCTFLHRW